MKSIWILVAKHNSGENGLQIHLAYSGMYGADTCPAFRLKEDAEFYQKNNLKYSHWQLMELPIWPNK